MMFTRHFVLMTVTAIMTFVAPCVAQDAKESGQAAPNVTGTGQANHIPIWRNATTLGSSGIVSTGGNVGIGTSAPAARLEVSGDAQVDGNFSLSGSILLTGVGSLIWAPNDGSGNFAAGLFSGTTGANNTAMGDYALQFNTTGTQNTASGTGALQHNNTGGGNTAVGTGALQSNTSGSGNTAIGDGAMGINATGYQNTAVGEAALLVNTIGAFNVAIGQVALENNTMGNSNIAIGFEAGSNLTSTSNNIEIGNLGNATDSDTIRIGTSGTQTSTLIAGIYGSATSLANVPVVVDANGQLGTVQSSARYKDDIQDMGDTSEGFMRLRPVTFRYKKAYEDGSKPLQYGLIAEEVAEVYPDMVARSADGQIESVRYQLLDPMLLNELQKQHVTITAQQETIRSLEERLARVEAALSGTTVSAAVR
jgi:hypothetical protein